MHKSDFNNNKKHPFFVLGGLMGSLLKLVPDLV